MFNDEKVIGSWTTNFLSAGFRATGKLTVTEAAIYCLPSTVISGSINKAANLFREQEEGVYLCRLAPQDILSATARSKLLNKRIVMRIRNMEGLDREVIIDNGALSIKSIIEAISRLTKVDGAV
ncbi:MAG: hypothetical protein GX617_17295 [Lentisphaerae bacterium]|nr:hypothetical protein [Lentisphaerota bacterium]